MQIFLGYASEHIDAATEIATFLKNEGHNVWFDKESLIPGIDWDEDRLRGQESADLIIHLCSREIVSRKGVVNREIRKTLTLLDDQPFGVIFVIFVRLEDFSLPRELKRFHYVDYFDLEWKIKLHATLTVRNDQLGHITSNAKSHDNLINVKPQADNKAEIEETIGIHKRSAAYPLYKEQGLYWSYVNSAIQSFALEGYIRAAHDFEEYSGFDQSTTAIPEKAYEWQITSEEFFRSGEVVSVRFTTYYDFGGAHGNYFISTLNFAGSEIGIISIEDLIGRNEDNAKRILEYCKTVIKAGYDPADEFEFFDFEITEHQIWQLLSNFNFDKRGFTFNFSPYAISAYVYGAHEVLVPWSVIGEMIIDTYKVIMETLSGRPGG